MKATRIISVLTAMMLLLSVFALSASADPVVYDGSELTLNIHLFAGTPGTATAGTENATGKADVEGVNPALETPIANAVFEIRNAADEVVATVTTNTSGLASKSGLEKGRYTVHQTTLGAGQSAAAADFQVDLPLTNPTNDGLLYTVDVYPKVPVYNDIPTITKKVSDTDADYRQSASILSYSDKPAWWKITVALPDNVKNFKKLTVTDILDKRLIDPDNLTVVYASAELTKDTDYTAAFSADGRKLVVDFTAAGIAKLVDKTNVEIKFTTKIDLTQENTIATAIGNHTTLTYKDALDVDGYTDNTPDNHTDDTDPDKPEFDPDDTDNYDPEKWPNHPGDDEDGDDAQDPYVWTGALDFVKIEKGDASKKLTPKFDLYNASNVKLGTLTSTDGNYTAKGLAAGSYYLIETTAPEGYELIGEKIEFTVGSTVAGAIVKFDQTAADSIAAATEIKFAYTEEGVSTNYIVNKPSTKLPLTGGMGVGSFALIGLAFFAVGGTVLVKSKKDARA